MMLLFVYGTLKKGGSNQALLSDAIFLGQCSTDERFTMYDFDTYPAVTLNGSHSIAGEVYRISEDKLIEADELECYPEFYQRIMIDTPFGEAWMYIVEPALCIDKPELTGYWPLR